MRIQRAFFVLAASFAFVACASFAGPRDTEAADSHFANAQTYYYGRDLLRSADQIERGLQHDPDHYGLNLYKGLVALRIAARNPELFEQALETFERTGRLRSKSTHEYRYFIGLGMVHQGLYQQLSRRKRALEAEHDNQRTAAMRRVEIKAELPILTDKIEEHMNAAGKSFSQLLARDTDTGKFAAMRNLFIVETDRAIGLKDDAQKKKQLRKAANIVKDYLKANTYRQDHYGVMVDITANVDQERLGRERLRGLKQQEMDFRAAYANVLFKLGDFSDAREQLNRTIDLDPTVAAHYYNRARCSKELNDIAKARSDLQDFLRLTKSDFDAPQVREANRLLDELRRG